MLFHKIEALSIVAFIYRKIDTKKFPLFDNRGRIKAKKSMMKNKPNYLPTQLL